jgi:hypothetical protein
MKRQSLHSKAAFIAVCIVFSIQAVASAQTLPQQAPKGGAQGPSCGSPGVGVSGGGTCLETPVPRVSAQQIINQFDPSTLRLAVKSVGLYNLIGLGLWNGQPVSPTNTPSDDNRLLEADINLFVSASAVNILYVQVTNVVTTLGAFWSGTAFDNVTQTGVRITFPDQSPFSQEVTFSGNFANPNEILADGTSGTEIAIPLSNTPGFAIAVTPPTLLIQTTNGANNGFTSLGGIYGATRIRGGGVFQLTFAPSADLTKVDFSKVLVESEYGLANQFITAVDSIPPVTTVSALPLPNANGWNNTNITVSLNAIDNPGGSGVQQIQFALGGAQNTGWQTATGNAVSVTISSAGTTTLSYFAADNLGNQETAKTLTVRIDKTPPVITPQINGTQGNNGSYRGTVSVAWNVVDPESGIASSAGCTTTNLTTDTAGVTLTCSATDRAGLSTSVSVTIKIDNSAILIPNISMIAPGGSLPFPVSLAVPAGPNGVTVTLMTSDSSRVAMTPAGGDTFNVFIPSGATSPNIVPNLYGINFGTVKVTATAFGFISSSGTVQVGANLSFAPSNLTVIQNTKRSLTLHLSAVVPVGGLTVNLTSDNPGAVGVVTTVLFASGAADVNVPVTAIGVGTATITATAVASNVSPVTATVTAVAALTVTTTVLSDGTVGASYSQTLAATWGVTPYTWTLVGGTLPAGLTLNAATGRISGTPSLPVNRTPLVFQVTDSSFPAQTATVYTTITTRQ